MKNPNFPWKQHFRQLPDGMLTRVNRLRTDDVVVGCVRKIAEPDITSGLFRHLSIEWTTTGPAFPEAVVPPMEGGPYSAANMDGKEVARKDLPKIWRTYTFETPNWGDPSRGYHDVDIDRQVYRREFIPPRELAVTISLIAEEPGPTRRFVFKFTVGTVLNRRREDFADELLFTVNLLQENVGAADVLASDATTSDYLRTVYVRWEILPPGERDDNIARILSGFRAQNEEQRRKLIERYDYMAKLKPIAFIAGQSGFRRYFGAQFADDLVAFENIEYGNALYVMFDGWDKLSQRSRLELLAGKREGFVRIVHGEGWKQKLAGVVRGKRKGNQQPLPK